MSETQENPQPSVSRGLYWGAWVFAIALVVIAVYLGWRVTSVQAGPSEQTKVPDLPEPQQLTNVELNLPKLSEPDKQAAISRQTNLHTVIPTRQRQMLKITQLRLAIRYLRLLNLLDLNLSQFCGRIMHC